MRSTQPPEFCRTPPLPSKAFGTSSPFPMFIEMYRETRNGPFIVVYVQHPGTEDQYGYKTPVCPKNWSISLQNYTCAKAQTTLVCRAASPFRPASQIYAAGRAQFTLNGGSRYSQLRLSRVNKTRA